MNDMEPLLAVSDLSVRFDSRGKSVHAVQALSYTLRAGETLAIVGGSGGGKTTSCRALVGLLPASARITGSIRYAGTELVGIPEREMQKYRGSCLAIVFQDTARALNPTLRIGRQLAQAIALHRRTDGATSREAALELLGLLGIRDAAGVLQRYPHELSGGMRQRVAIAIALSGRPRLLIADEATRSLDAINRLETLRLLKEVQKATGMAIVAIVHDLRQVAEFADNVLVMHDGRAVEYLPARHLRTQARTDYTRALFEASPSLDRDVPARSIAARPVLRVRGVCHEFDTGRRILDGVSFDLRPGEMFGLVGESGSGKTSLARAVLQLPRPTNGSVLLDSTDLTRLRGRALQRQRRGIQMIFQDPTASLDPTWRVSRTVEEPLLAEGSSSPQQRARRVAELLELVGLPPETFGARRPAELSGGQCQRVAIARALAADPVVLICDEAVSSLDALMQIQLMSLLDGLRHTMRLACLFISHDLALVRQIADRVAVMYQGQLCEVASTAALYERPSHPYTAKLIASVASYR